jgi:hypothetical protein
MKPLYQRNHLGPSLGAKPQKTQLTHVSRGVVPCVASRFFSALRWMLNGYQISTTKDDCRERFFCQRQSVSDKNFLRLHILKEEIAR